MQAKIYEFDRLPQLAAVEERSSARGPVPASGGGSAPLVGLIRNPRSHRNKGRMPDLAERANVLTQTPRTRPALREALAEFARRGVEYLAVDGGDGTVRDVLTCGSDVFGDDWPRLIVLPRGKTNALAVDLGLPEHWSLVEALAAADRGSILVRRPLKVCEAATPDACVQGFLLGAGAFTMAIKEGQRVHRWGAFSSFAVGLTIAMGMLQTLFAGSRNPWRALTPMQLRTLPGDAEVPHSREANAGERFLAVATVLERFPLGASPFAALPPAGIKIAVMDWPHRWLVALFPLLLLGWDGPLLRRNGGHRLAADALDLDLGGSFILDGEAFPPGRYRIEQGPSLRFVVP